MFRKALALAAAIALPALAVAQTAPTFKTGVASSDTNPQPVKIMCWNGVNYYQCNPGSGGGGGGGGTGDATEATQQAQLAQAQQTNTRIGDVTAPATGSVNQRLGVLSTAIGDPSTPGTGSVNQRLGALNATASTLFKEGDLIGNESFGSLQLGDWNVGVTSLPALASGTNVIGDVRNITGTIPLATGAATSAGQTTGNNSLAQIATSLSGPLTVGTHAVTQSGGWTVGVSSLPALPTGSNTIGSIANTSFGVSSLPALPTGTNTIGTVNLGTIGTAATAANQTTLNGYVDGLEAAAGAPADTAWTGTGSASTISLLKTIANASLDTSTPALNIAQFGGSNVTLGQKTQANSIPVTLASDGTYAKSTDITTLGQQFPSSVGPKASAQSLAVVLPADGNQATAANQVTTNTSLASIDTKTPTLGPKSNAGSVPITAPKAATETRSSVAVATTSTLLLAANSARMGCSIIFEANTSGYIGLSSGVTSTSYTYPLVGAASAPYTVFTCPSNWTGPVYGLGGAATGNYRISELTQ